LPFKQEKTGRNRLGSQRVGGTRHLAGLISRSHRFKSGTRHEGSGFDSLIGGSSEGAGSNPASPTFHASGNGLFPLRSRSAGAWFDSRRKRTLSRISPEWQAVCKTAVAGSTPERGSIFGGGAHAMDAPSPAIQLPSRSLKSGGWNGSVLRPVWSNGPGGRSHTGDWPQTVWRPAPRSVIMVTWASGPDWPSGRGPR
jgi:hypothetical protein